MSTKQERTQKIIDSFRGVNNEFHLLKGLLMAANALDREDKLALRKQYDTMMIAERMDELRVLASEKKAATKG